MLPKDYNPFRSQPYPLLIVLDGENSRYGAIPIPTIIDNLTAEKKIVPTIIVFVGTSNGRTRALEYQCNDLFTDFLALQFLPYLRDKIHLRITENPREITLHGISLGGLAVIYAGLRYPNTFGKVLSQSASLCHPKAERIIMQINENPYRYYDMKFYLEAGSFEDGPSETNLSLKGANEKIVRLMQEKGMPVMYHRFTGGHEYICWQDSFPIALCALNKRQEKLTSVSRKPLLFSLGQQLLSENKLVDQTQMSIINSL